MYNKVVLMGNLTRDVDIRYSQSGSAIGNTGIAVNRKWKSSTGEQKEEVMFVDLTFFGRTAEIANQYLRRGKKVLIDGRLSLSQWTSKDGQKRSKHSIIVENLQMIGGRDDNPNNGQENNNQQYGGMQHQQQQPYNNNQNYGNSQQPQQTNQNQHQDPNQPTQQQQKELPSIDINEDEIPF